MLQAVCLTKLIMEHLAVHDRQSASTTALAIGREQRSVSRRMNELSLTGKIFRVDRIAKGQMRSIIYSMHKPVVENMPRRYVPEFRKMTPADHNIWSHRDLALAGR